MRTPILIGGVRTEGNGQTIVSVNPADGSIVGELQAASETDVNEAVSAATAALDQGGWRRMLPHKRAFYLHQIAKVIRDRASSLARLQMLENGKTIKECRDQAASAADIFQYFASLCETMEETLTPPRGDYIAMTVYEPIGVVTAVTPHNSPLTLGAQKLAGALAAGNAVILKPAEVTSIVSLELGQAVVDANIPPGLVSVLPGGPEVVKSLLQHRDVGMITFTGGTRAGREIAQTASNRLIPALLELGGKSPNIIFEDAELCAAIPGAVYGIFSSAGQSCTAGSRLFVQESIYDFVVEQLIRLTSRIKVGAPDDETSMIGPLSSFGDRDRVEKWVAQGRSDGGVVVVGGTRPQGEYFAKGAYYLPTVLIGISNKSSICQEEVFGPVLCVIPFRNESDLVDQANDSVYGLAAGVWTTDLQKAWRVARALQAGTVWINTFRHLSIAAQFGGFKDSGLGREKGPQGLRVYQQAKSIYWGFASLPWQQQLT